MVQQRYPAKFSGIIVAVDRMEGNAEGKNTIEAFQEETNIPIKSIVSIEEICEYLLDREINDEVYLDTETDNRIKAYLQQFAVRS